MDYVSEVASVKTSGSRIFNDVKLDGLTWSGVVAGLMEYEAYVFNVTPITREGPGQSLVTTPTHPKAGTVQSSTLTDAYSIQLVNMECVVVCYNTVQGVSLLWNSSCITVLFLPNYKPYKLL